MIQKAERGEKIQLKSAETRQNIENLQTKHYYVADEIKGLPNKDTKEIVVVRDPSSKMADVVLPAGASLAVDNEIPGMNKNLMFLQSEIDEWLLKNRVKTSKSLDGKP